MANDRIWLVCTSCGERLLVTKHYPGCHIEELWESENIVPFMVEHLRHHPGAKAMHLEGNPGLAIVTDAHFHGASGRIACAAVRQWFGAWRANPEQCLRETREEMVAARAVSPLPDE